MNSNDTGNYKAEYFFYHNNNYTVYHKQCYGIQSLNIEIYNRNGSPHRTIELKVNGCYDHSYAKVLLSPSGRYMFICEDKLQPDGTNKAIGKILELVMDKETKDFSLSSKLEIEDFTERYGKTQAEFNNYDYYTNTKYYLTDNIEIFIANKNENYVMFEEIKCKEELEKKFGKSEWDKERWNNIADLTIVMKNGGFAFYTQEEVHFLRVDSENRKFMPLVRCNFKINKGQMTVNQVCPCPDPKLIIIALFKGYSDHLLLVWDIEENREVYNFSTSKSWSFIYGPGSKAGFILNGDTYVNLDKGLINYFFEYEFTTNALYEQI